MTTTPLFGVDSMLYVTAAVTVASFFYLVYAMIRPERF